MAKVKAVCRCATCGNEFMVEATKPNRKSADDWKKWAEETLDECEECRRKRIEKARAEEAAKAAELAKESGLPELTGTPKQVSWAETIRRGCLETLDEFIEKLTTSVKEGKSSYELRKKVERDDVDTFTEFRKWVSGKESAKFWIDWRYAFERNAMPMFTELKFEFVRALKAKQTEEVQEEVTVTVQPEEQKETTLCTVEYTEEKVTVKSSYNPNMPPVVKAAGYRWDGDTWSRQMYASTGDPADRAAEIANKLLLAGFPVRMPKEIKERATAGTYEPEWKRWIFWNAKREMFRFDGDVGIEGIPGAKYDYAPITAYAEIEEFARFHDYRFTPIAREKLEEYKSSLTSSAITAGQEAEYHEGSTKEILDSSRDVLEDLKEED